MATHSATRTKHNLSLAALLIALATQAGPAVGQEFSQPSVSGAGIVALERTPTIMRMQAIVVAKGPTIVDAMARLKTKKALAARKLEKLAPLKDSVIMMPAVAGMPNSDEYEREMSHIMRRLKMMAKEKGTKFTPVKQTYVWCLVTASWQLGGEDLDARLIESQTLKTKIEEADIPGEKDIAMLSAEEMDSEKAIAELAEEYGDPFSDREAAALRFCYIAKVTDADRKRCRADAFLKARLDAEAKAALAGQKIGELLHVDTDDGLDGREEEEWQSYPPVNMRHYRYERTGMKAAGPDEIAGDYVNVAVLRTSVRAMYQLKK